MQSKPCTPLLRRGGACATPGQCLAGGGDGGTGKRGRGARERVVWRGGGGGRGGGDGGSEGGMGGRGPETRDAAAAAQPELLGRHKPLK